MTRIILLSFLCIAGSMSNAQVAVSADGSTADASAMLEVKSTNKGILIPRMSTAQRALIASPATGLLVFDNDTESFWFYNGTTWSELLSGRDHLSDADGDTRVLVEKFPDEDRIRFETNGTEVMHISNTGQVGIGTTTTPFTRLHVQGGSILFSGSTGGTPIEGGGTRMMWIPERQAFRAGAVNHTEWDDTNIGNFSFVAGGLGNTASGPNAIIGAGSNHLASGSHSSIIGGTFNSATVINAAIIGGMQNIAGGQSAFIGGGMQNAISNAGMSAFIAGGNSNTASGTNAFIGAGLNNTTSGTASFTGGGRQLLAASYAEAVFGQYNEDLGGNGTSWNSDDPLFVIGNGNSDSRSNAVTVRKNGRVGIGISAVAARLHVHNGTVLFSGGSGMTPISGAGRRVMWIPSKYAFRAGEVSGGQWDDMSIGTGSFVGGGFNNVASGNDTFVGGGHANNAIGATSAIVGGGLNVTTGSGSASIGGFENTATGIQSVIIGGSNNSATGTWSTIVGGFTNTASGLYSFVGSGYQLIAGSWGEVVFGRYNEELGGSLSEWNPQDPLFVIGNGSSGTRANAVTIRKNGLVGIGTSSPAARLHVHSGAVLYTGTSGSTPVSGAGRRMMWIPAKGAFRAGNITGAQWDDENIGAYSFVGGGSNNIATGEYTSVNGGFLNACYNSSDFSTIQGGNGNAIYGMGSGISAGTSNIVFANRALIAGGISNVASGNASFIGGGLGLITRSYGEAAFGRYNEFLPGDTANWNADDPLFVIGNGTSQTRANAITVIKNGRVGIGTSSPRQHVSIGEFLDLYSGSINSPTVPSIRASSANNLILSAYDNGALFINNDGGTGGLRIHNGSPGSANEIVRITGDGFMGIGTNAPSQKLHVAGNICYTGSISACSDRRYKTKLQPLQDITQAITAIGTFRYQWNLASFPDKNFDDQPQIGIIAQDVQTYFPELILTDADGYLSIDYTRLSVLLLAAMKEQVQIIHDLRESNGLQQQVNFSLRSEIAEIRAMIIEMRHPQEQQQD